MMWRQAHFGAVMSGLLQLPCTNSTETGEGKEVIHSSLRSNPMEVREFCLDDVRGPVCTTQKVTIPPFSTISVHANTSVKGHFAGPHAHGTDARSPVAYSSGANSDLWRTTSGVIQGTYLLSVQLGCPFCRNPCKDCGWTGSTCQPSVTGGPPSKDFQGIQ